MMYDMKIAWISWLRWFSMMLIFLYHLNQIRPIQNLEKWDWEIYQFVSLLPVVVSIFFLLWWFLRSLSYWKVFFEWGKIPPFWKWMKDRFFRIAPLYYLAVILSFAISIIFTNPDWKSFFVAFTFFNWIHPSTFFPVALNGPLWFVSYDMMGNLFVMIFMTSLLALLQREKKYRALLTIIFFLLGFSLLILLHFVFISLPFPHSEWIVSVWFPYYNPYMFGLYYLFWAMIAGIYLFLEKHKIPRDSLFDGLFFGICLIIIHYLNSILWANDLAYSFPRSPYRFPLLPLLFGIWIFTLLMSRYLAKWIDNRLFLFFARISYALYLTHALIIAILYETFFWWKLITFNDWIFFSVVALLVSLFVAIILSKWEELFSKKYLASK